MKRIVLLAVPVTLAVMFAANAGTLDNGNWSPSGCGAMPEAPNVNASSVDTLNKSIAAVNDWQKQLQTYDECMIKEANADAAAISNAANAQQVRYREASAKINAELTAASDKFSSGATPSGVGPGNQGLGNPFGNPGGGNPGAGGMGY
ncbi:hypothetical protein SAMN05216420_101237 [Nitrosospira sp. Nl5]|uniref:hypothetical protein n=1 Tax=Nitrosospira sp. Nl5 TaxID=200120 RepID=UPI00088BE350|nr:hypothetical protein [Nitrosospira sp. Nl5]SCX89039.1 hypothetical protein SAMN05216420_101237 [Nitrosospira sp. Nl5]